MVIRVDVSRDATAFDALEADWRRLEQISRHSSIFLSWDWQRIWWTHYGDRRELRLLVAREDDRVVGLLPLYQEVYRRLGGLLAPRKLRQVGVGGDTAPDDLGALIESGREREVSDALIRHVMVDLVDWDMLAWSDLSPDCPLLDALAQQSKDFRVRIDRRESDPITYGDLPHEWEDYRRSLSRNRRETMGRKRRKFESQSGALLKVITAPESLDANFDILARLHRKRWEGRADRHAFSTKAYEGFHRDLMHALLPQDKLRLLALDIDGVTFAMLYGLKYRGAFCFFQSGFDPEYAAFSPGDVLLAYSVEQAIKEGCRVFDMQKGDHDYKRHFFQQSRQNIELEGFRPGIIDWAYRIKSKLNSSDAG